MKQLGGVVARLCMFGRRVIQGMGGCSKFINVIDLINHQNASNCSSTY
jgi:hypothetical protein